MCVAELELTEEAQELKDKRTERILRRGDERVFLCKWMMTKKTEVKGTLCQNSFGRQ